MIRKEQKHVPFPNTGENLGQHRTIWQEAPAWIFGSIQSLENEGILYVFLVFQTEEVGQKDGCGSQTQLRGVALKRGRKNTGLLQNTPMKKPHRPSRKGLADVVFCVRIKLL